jgi:excisionase family DNA binding protein
MENEQDALLLSVGEVAKLCACSPRTIYRLSDAGKMPGPVKVGALVRWQREAILSWIGEGCQPTAKHLTKWKD